MAAPKEATLTELLAAIKELTAAVREQTELLLAAMK